MKCEKCGIEILEGNLCDNCKNVTLNNSQLEEVMPVQEVSNEVPTVVEEVTLVQGNPNAEGAVTEHVVSNEQSSMSEGVSDVGSSGSVMPKKNKNNLIIVIVIAIIVVSVIIFGIKVASGTKDVNDMFTSAKVNAFVTQVQYHMDVAKTSFMELAVDNPGTDIVFTSDNTGDSKLIFNDYESDKLYYIKMNRQGMFVELVIYDDNFCYQADIDNVDVFSEEEFDKTDVHSYDVRWSGKKDSFNGCTGENIQ